MAAPIDEMKGRMKGKTLDRYNKIVEWRENVRDGKIALKHSYPQDED